MPLFDFITDQSLRGSLQADYREMLSCMDCGAWKGAHVLAGSIVEAILLDSLVEAGGIDRNTALKMDLGQALIAAQSQKLISATARDLASVVRDYRNLIHPGRAIRLRENVTPETAQVAKALVSIVVEEITKKRQESYGYTAEQIASKIERDSFSASIIPHLLSDANPRELERLVLEVLPERYIVMRQDEYQPQHLAPTLVSCFRAAFAKLPQDVRDRIARHFLKLLKEEGDPVLETYWTAFVRCVDFSGLPVESSKIVKHYLLGRLGNSPTEALVDSLEGIGGILESRDVLGFVDPLVRLMCREKPGRVGAAAAKRLKGEGWLMPEEIRQPVTSRIEAWSDLFKEKEQAGYVSKLDEVKGDLEFPF